MTEENQTQSDSSSHEAGKKISQIEALEGKLRILRWGLFLGVFAILLIGISSIYNTSREAIKPVEEVYAEAKTAYKGVEGKVRDAQTTFNRLDPKVRKAYETLNELLDRNSEPSQKLRTELQDRLDNEIKPAAEDLARKVLVDLQYDAMNQLAKISNNSDNIMWSAREEYHRLTNNLPGNVTDAIEETLLKMIHSRDERIRKMFPKLTKEKQGEVVSRFSELTEEQGQELFGALFADHLTELTQLQANMDKIYDRESGSGDLKEKTSVESTIALLKAVLDIAMNEYGSSSTDKPAKPQTEEVETATEPAQPSPAAEDRQPEETQPTETAPEPAPTQPKATQASGK